MYRSIFAILILQFASPVYADIEFISSSTTSQVVTPAGSQRTNGIQKSPNSRGIVENFSFAEVKETPELLNAGGVASCTIELDAIDRQNMFVFMQVAATTLPEFQQGTFAETSVQYFFSNKTEIEVERRIKQGDARFFIDSIERTLTGTITRFQLEAGIHTLEIEVVPGKNQGDVTNPNFAINIFATDNGVIETPGGSNPPQNPDAGNEPEISIQTNLNNSLLTIKSIKSKVNKNNKEAQKNALSALKASLDSVGAEIKNSSLFAANKSLLSLSKAAARAFKSLKKAKTSESIKSAKSSLSRAVKKLIKEFGKI